jgi:pyrimidine operon attenuation protein/uracil phosphoribosyltransferase
LTSVAATVSLSSRLQQKAAPLRGEAPTGSGLVTDGSKTQRVHGEAAVRSAIDALAREIGSLITDGRPAALVGIRTRGLVIARRLFESLHAGHPALRFGVLDITLYRDDLSTLASQPVVGTTELDFPVDGCTVILVDDVIYTGRTARAAIEAVVAYGRPAAIRLAVLVDRGHREYPIHADFTSFQVATAPDQIVHVRLHETDGEDAVDLVTR